MALTVEIRTYDNQIQDTCAHPAILEMCRRAAELTLPMLAYVDRYDDTTFNRAQMRAVRPELSLLAGEPAPGVAQAASELLDLVSRVERHPHLYLVFNGD
jgi:hypothetical protein